MQRCPHCSEEIRIRELPHPDLVRNYRICPHCGGSFTVDPDSKRRQAVFLVITLISLVVTLLLYFAGTAWLIPAVISYILAGAVLYWGNRKVYLVPYNKGQKSDSDA